MKFYRESMNGNGIEYGFQLSERIKFAVGVVDTMDGVPLKCAVVVCFNRPYHVGSFQLHILKARIGVMFPMRWKYGYEIMRWSFPKMPEVKS